MCVRDKRSSYFIILVGNSAKKFDCTDIFLLQWLEVGVDVDVDVDAEGVAAVAAGTAVRKAASKAAMVTLKCRTLL